jgi:2-polyprenyl-3-methyl-5-hydroxy-6-metoxy-1,4-benzoquinol methylase
MQKEQHSSQNSSYIKNDHVKTDLLTAFEPSVSKEGMAYEYWIKKNWYYHGLLAKFYQFVIPENVRVLHVGSKSGNLLRTIKPSVGVGIDEDVQIIKYAQKQYPELSFYAGTVADLPQDMQFDYIILSSVTMEIEEVQKFFESLHRVMHPGTRLVIDTHSHLWEPVLWLAQVLGLRRFTHFKNWLSSHNLCNLLHLANFEVVTTGSQILFPVRIPGLSWFLNNIIATIPLIESLCLNRWIIARPLQHQLNPQDYSVSVIIPCKNERGNIEAAVQRCPQMGKHTEIIFVDDDHSKDGTYEEIQRVAAQYTDRDITFFKQGGKGKGDAVRKGFARAQGDVLMILDADLTVPPEELPKFFEALMRGKGDFINGSRLVYGMESEAMRFLNLIANTLFGVGFSWLLRQQIKDTLCGTKVLFKRDYEKIAIGRAYFGDFDPFGDFDLLFGAAKQNLKIIDMPVHYKNRTYGVTQISRFRHGLLLLYMSFVAWVKFKMR